ncbi:MAG: hypothetical protein HY673_26365 [Chloroflexi bacterium]|nr:hypothetical protein [Chloroflexota bacterium]
MPVVDYTQAFEHSVGKLSKKFVRLPFTFQGEADIQATLFGYLMQDKVFSPVVDKPEHQYHGQRVGLVHLEFPVLWKNGDKKGRYDFVIWNPKQAKKSLDRWGDDDAVIRNVPILIAAEIKYLWSLAHLKNLCSYNKLAKSQDVKKLTGGKSSYSYYLVFWDNNIDPDYGADFDRMHRAFKQLRSLTGRRFRVLFVTRDGKSIKLGFSTRASP